MRKYAEKFCQEIVDFVDRYKEENGSSPTLREIETETGLSRSTVARYLSAMRENGTLDYSGHRNITTKRSQQIKEESVVVPVLGSVSCGIPKLAEENIEEYVRLPIALFGRGEFFLLHASGDSMIEADIHDGDLVLIRQQNYAYPGDIVVALMGDEATLKRFYPERENRRIRLHPENSKMDDIYVDDCQIQGVAVNILKDLVR